MVQQTSHNNLNLQKLLFQAQYCVQQDKFHSAWALYQQILTIDPNNSQALNNLGLIEFSFNNYSVAENLLSRALKFPANQTAETFFYLARCYEHNHNPEQAIKIYQKIIDLKPKYAAAHYNLALLFKNNDQASQAIYHLEQTIKLTPENYSARHMLQALQNNNDNNKKWDPTTKQYLQELFDPYAAYYDRHLRDNLKYKTPEILRELIGEYLICTQTRNVLDLGCGTGQLGVYFRDIAEILVGVDISHPMLSQAKKSGYYDLLVQADFRDYIPRVNNNYDLIIAADSLVYHGCLEKIFKVCTHKLNQRGFLLINTEYCENLNFNLLKSGRYAHNSDYILNLAKKFKLKLLKKSNFSGREKIPNTGFILQK